MRLYRSVLSTRCSGGTKDTLDRLSDRVGHAVNDLRVIPFHHHASEGLGP